MNKKLIHAFLGLIICCASSLAEEMARSDAAGVAADSANPDVVNTDGNSELSRIRIFGQNNATASLFKGMDCVKSAWGSDAIMVSGSVGSAFGSLFGAVSNTSIGIPETETTRYLSRRDGILSKAYYREYEIPAGKPTSMRLGFQNPSSFYQFPNGAVHAHGGGGCHGAISFVPKAGEDYEVGFSRVEGGCVLSVNKVIKKDDLAELVPVPITPAEHCAAN